MNRLTAALTSLRSPQAHNEATRETSASGAPIQMRHVVAALAAGGLAATGLLAPMSGASAAGSGQPAAAATVATSFGLGHHAFGTKVSGNAVVGSGPTANSVIGCTNLAGLSRRNSVASVDLPLVNTGEVVSTGTTTKQNGVVTVTSRNTIAEGSLLGGDVRFRGLSSESRTWHDDNGFHNRVAFDLARLVVDGNVVSLNGDRQTFNIVGQGTVTVFGQSTKLTAAGASARGLALKLELTNGTKLQVGSSYSRMLSRVFGPMSGSTWASQVDALDKAARSGRTGYQVMPCQGTNGVVRENATADVDVNALTTTGAATQVFGIQGPDVQRGYTQAEVAEARISTLGLTASGIESKANVRRDNGTLSRNANGTHLLELELNGVDIRDQLRAGVPRDFLGFGTITFKKVTNIRNGIEVVALEVVLLDDTVIELGHSTMRIAQN